MSTTDTGGPAFPHPGEAIDAEFYEKHRISGLSTRDYFAAKAMHPFSAGAVLPHGYDASGDFREIARRAYELADAMLLARSAS